jgi:hypothetical protein
MRDPQDVADEAELFAEQWDQDHEDEAEAARRDLQYRDEVLHAEKIYNKFDEWLEEQSDQAQAKVIADIRKHYHQGENFLFNLKRLNEKGYKRFFLLFRHILTNEIADLPADDYFIKFKLLTSGNWQTHRLDQQIFRQMLKNIDQHEFLFNDVSPQLYFMMSGQDVEHEFSTFEAIHIVKHGDGGGVPLGQIDEDAEDYGAEYLEPGAPAEDRGAVGG